MKLATLILVVLTAPASAYAGFNCVSPDGGLTATVDQETPGNAVLEIRNRKVETIAILKVENSTLGNVDASYTAQVNPRDPSFGS